LCDETDELVAFEVHSNPRTSKQPF
jgi:hypothetical protein